MKWNPPANLLVLRPVTQSEKTQGGVFIPETSRKLIDEGVVVELGPKVDQSLFAGGIKIGDRVAVRRYAGGWLKLAKGDDQLGTGDELNRLIIEDEDVMAVPTDG
jgi:co-chaperonin GroES (HSP10)